MESMSQGCRVILLWFVIKYRLESARPKTSQVPLQALPMRVHDCPPPPTPHGAGFHPPAPSGEHGEVLLHPYRWLVVDDRSRTLAASSSGPAKAMRDLVCLLLEPLPEGLPPCRLPGNDGASNQLAFLPGPAVRVSGDQLRQLKACHVALAQLMLARGPPRHAAGQRRKAEVAVAVAAEAADGEGGMVPEPGEIVAGATGGTTPAPPHADIGRAGVAHEAAPTPHDDRPEDKGTDLFVRALVRRIIDRVIILQDGHLPKSRRGKASRAAGVSPEALSFLLAPAGWQAYLCTAFLLRPKVPAPNSIAATPCFPIA